MSEATVVKSINGIYVVDGVYFTTGGLYQSTLSNQNLINIKNIIKNTKKRYVSVSNKLRNTACFSTREELEEICKVDKKDGSKQFPLELKNSLVDSENLPTLKTLPVVCPLGLYIIENYQPITRKKENCIIAMKLGEKTTKKGQVETIYAAITVFNESLYFYDRNGEFVGNETELINYIKKIRDKITLTSVHSTVECYEKIENTFFNDTFQFKRIGVDSKAQNLDAFKYNSEEIFFSKKALSNANGIKFYDFNEKEEKIKKYSIIGAITLTVLGVGGYFGYSYYDSYMEQKALEEEAAREAAKPKEIPRVSYNTINYFNDYCFKKLDLFSGEAKSWYLSGIKCDTKGVSYTIKNGVDLGNYLTNKNDFYQVYNIESKSYSSFKFDNNGTSVVYTPPNSKFVGMKQTEVHDYSENEVRNYISTLTENGNNIDYVIKTELKNNQLSSWTIKSNYSPMYLQENYHLFNKIYVQSIELNVDSSTGIFNWTIKGIFN